MSRRAETSLRRFQAALPARRGNRYEQYFDRHGVNGLIRHFESLEVSPTQRRGMNQRPRYVRTHQKRMQDHHFRRAGEPIGSGDVEGACKSLIRQRTDLSGRRWSLDGALTGLWGRALVNEGLHDRYGKVRSH